MRVQLISFSRSYLWHDVGLDYLHTGCKIVHRDVKSSNILLSENLEAKISDFGLSKVFGGNGNTSLMSVCGTPGYMDPEYSLSLSLIHFQVYPVGLPNKWFGTSVIKRENSFYVLGKIGSRRDCF